MYKILVVDDEPFIREGLKKIIEDQKLNFYVSGEAEDGTDALKLIAEEKPDIIITDIKMIEMDGPELIKRVFEIYSNSIKFIILSAYGDFHYAQTTMKYGVSDYILKPIDSKELLEAIHRIVSTLDKRVLIESEYHNGIRVMMIQEMKKLMISDGYIHLKEKLLPFFSLQEEGQYWCAIADFSSAPSALKDLIEKVMGSFQEQTRGCKCVIEENSSLYYLVFQATNDKFFRKDSIEWYRKVFGALLEIKATVYIGDIVKGFERIGISFKNAKNAYDKKFYYDEEQLVFFENMPRKQERLENDLLPFLESITEDIYEKKEKEIYLDSEELFSYIKKNQIQQDMVKININQFATNLTKRIDEFGADTACLLDLEYRLCHLDYSKTSILKVKILFEEFCIQSTLALEQISGEKPSDLIYKIQQYLREHYKADLKIKDIAEVFYLNPVYLGQFFKKKTGVYINDYINELRIEEAKQLLKNTRYKAYEISGMVGFVNSDYFTTKFEKAVKMTPIQYRKGEQQ